METYFPGTRVLVFDTQLYVDDKKTPLSITVKPTTVICWYGKRSKHFGWTDGNLIDVDFDHRGKSYGHFADMTTKIN